MIEFKVIIKQMEDGKISCSCRTFPGMATQAEHDAAHEFMELFRAFTVKEGGVIQQDWKGTNDAKRN